MWDVIGEITFSQPLGFLETGADLEQILSGAEASLDYFTVVGSFPCFCFTSSDTICSSPDWSNPFLLDKNPIHRIGPPSFGAAVAMSVQRTMARISGTDQHPTGGQKDLLDQFIEKKKEADWVDNQKSSGWLCINVS